MNKKGDELVPEDIIFIILNLIFFVTLLVFIARSSMGATIYEEVYAKKIALLIDEAKPGITMTLDASKPLEIAEKNGVENNVLVIKDNKIYVNFGIGYSFAYFSDYKVYSSPDWQNKKFVIEVKEA